MNTQADQNARTDQADLEELEELEELASRVRVAVTRLNRRLRQQSLAGLSAAQASALGSIAHLGHPSLGELAGAEGVQPPTMTRIVATMEQAGLVERLADRDGRVCRVALSAGGRRTLARIRHLKSAYLAQRFEELAPEERERLGDVATVLEHLVSAG